ncbi:hypothetical protein [Cypionkella sp. TWP1-2-1b2]|uniref:hypothetical protein n=1 Tax=Cypionkella sp. TWP1-2-1b2 TaxID=2804675 RepID=UPI003CF4BFF8
MLKFQKNSTMVLLVILALQLGCSKAPAEGSMAVRTRSEDDLNNKLKIEIGDLKHLSSGGIQFLVTLSNTADFPICAGSDLEWSTAIELRERTSRYQVFSQTDDSALPDLDSTDPRKFRAPSNYKKPPYILTAKSRIGYEVTQASIVNPYLVDDSYVYVRDLERKETLYANVNITVFDCKYKNLRDALDAKGGVNIVSKSVKIPSNVDGFFIFKK